MNCDPTEYQPERSEYVCVSCGKSGFKVASTGCQDQGCLKLHKSDILWCAYCGCSVDGSSFSVEQLVRRDSH